MKDEAVRLFETQQLPSRLEKKSLALGASDTELQNLDSAIASLSAISSERYAGTLADLESDRLRIVEERSELQNPLEIWGYLSIEPDELILDLLLPVREDRRNDGLEKFVTDHCINVLSRYGEPEIRTHNEYLDVHTPLLTLQQVGEIVVELSRNPSQLRDANSSFAIYQRHPPLSETYQLTERVEAPATADESSRTGRKSNVYGQSKGKAMEYLDRHPRGASRIELVAYLTGAGLGNERTAGNNVDIMNKGGVIRNVGKPQYPRYVKASQDQTQTEEARTPRTRITGVWPAVDDLMLNKYNGRAELGELVVDVIARLNASSRHKGVISGTIGRYAARHDYGIREEDEQKIIYSARQATIGQGNV